MKLTGTAILGSRGRIDLQHDAAEFQPPNRKGWGWFMAQVPFTTEAADPKNDEIPLMGVAVSFFERELDGQYVLEFEIFNL
jgi:hypothetical protein